MSVNKAIVSVCEGGINHKSNVVRTQVAMLIDHVITSIGPERFYGSSKDTQVTFFWPFRLLHSVIFNQKYGQFYFTFGDVIDESILRFFSQTLVLVESILPLDV